MKESTWQWWRELIQGRDLDRAARSESAAILKAAEGVIHPDLVAELAALLRDPCRAVRLGCFEEGPRKGGDLLVDLKDLLTHLYALGASGSGKTYTLLLLVLVLLRSGLIRSLVISDPKGEMAELMVELVLPALAASLPTKEADDLLKRIVVIDPFSSTHLPPLNVLVRDPGVPIEIQARDVAECFEAATSTDVSARMETVLDWVLRLVIEVGGSFLTVRRALQEAAVLEGLVRLSKEPDTIRYFLTRFPSEPKASKLALLSRLDRFLALPMTQLSVGAKYCLDFDRLLDDHITIFTSGRAPAGLRSVANFFEMVVMTRFVRAIFRRPPRSQSHAIIVVDEWQMTLNPALAAEFESILTLARSRSVHLWLANQHLSQLDRHGAPLRSVVLGGTPNQIFFRLALEDASTLRSVFPTTGAMRRRSVPMGGGATPFLTANEERDARIALASRCPNRTGYWLDRRRNWGSIAFRSATFDLPKVSSLPADYVRRAKRGSIAFTIRELEQMRDAENARLDALAAGPARPLPAPAAAPNSPSPAPLLGGPAPQGRARPKGRKIP